MVTGIALSGREKQMMDHLEDALAASLDLRTVLKDAYPLLLSLIGADYAALVAPGAESADLPEWIAHDLPPGFLGAYGKMAPHDFVLSSVLKNPGVVLRDAEMITRKDLEGNMMYQHARDVGATLEQVMAVMLHANDDFRSGISLYRDRRRPFSAREQRILQQLTPKIARTVHHCCTHARVNQRSKRLEAIIGAEKVATIVVQAPTQELERTPNATELLEAWFTPTELNGGKLPRILLEELAQAQRARAQGRIEPWLWNRAVAAVNLKVEFHPLPKLSESSWALVFREVSRVLTMPASWIPRLTTVEREVTSKMLLGFDNKQIAEELRNTESTVKVHVKHSFKKLGVENRVALLCRALLDA